MRIVRPHGQEQQRVGHRGQDLQAVEAERPVGRGRARGERHRADGQQDPRHVGQHVPRVREQRQAVREQRPRDLDDHHRCSDAEDDEQPPAVLHPGEASAP